MIHQFIVTVLTHVAIYIIRCCLQVLLYVGGSLDAIAYVAHHQDKHELQRILERI